MANLITIDDFKTYKGINSEEDDPIISLLIGSVSNFIKEYTDRALIDYAHIDKVEYFDAINYGEMYPYEFPLQSVTELAVSVDGGVTYTILVEDTDYFVDTQEDKVINNTGNIGFVTGTITHKSGRLTYQGGYDKTPQDLKLAAMDMVEYYRKGEHSMSMSMQSATVDNPVFELPGSLLPPHIKRVLDLYRVI
jgi:hypothetical protein